MLLPELSRSLARIGVFTLALTLAGCGSFETSDTSSPGPSADTRTTGLSPASVTSESAASLSEESTPLTSGPTD